MHYALASLSTRGLNNQTHHDHRRGRRNCLHVSSPRHTCTLVVAAVLGCCVSTNMSLLCICTPTPAHMPGALADSAEQTRSGMPYLVVLLLVAQRSNCNDLAMPPLRKSISLAAPCGPSLSGHLEKGGHARAGKRPVSEYGPGARRGQPGEVLGLPDQRMLPARSETASELSPLSSLLTF